MTFGLIDGQTIQIGKRIGRGGEGAVYEVVGRHDFAAKIYHDDIASRRRDKVLAMIQCKLFLGSEIVSFPREAIVDQNGQFVGYLMRRVQHCRPIMELYSPGSRKRYFSYADYRFLVRAAANLARAVASAHASGCVIGDVNQQGFLVSPQATVFLIDSDSFQVTANLKRYPCLVGVPEFTPPELQGHRLSKVIRQENHDNFGLALLVFHILFMGRHPYAGVYTGIGDAPSLPVAIKKFQYAYSLKRPQAKLRPPNGFPSLDMFPTALSGAFETAFGRDGARGCRPSAREWVDILMDFESALISCGQNPLHAYADNVLGCPWCAAEKSMGTKLFGSSAPNAGSIAIKVHGGSRKHLPPRAISGTRASLFHMSVGGVFSRPIVKIYGAILLGLFVTIFTLIKSYDSDPNKYIPTNDHSTNLEQNMLPPVGSGTYVDSSQTPGPTTSGNFYVLTPRNTKDIWTTSVYSYAEGGGGPGGGLDNAILRVGGWGDTYVSLLKFQMPPVAARKIWLAIYNNSRSQAPTPIFLNIINENWSWKPGDRLWWRDRPRWTPVRGKYIDVPRQGWVYIDITKWYLNVVNGTYANFGLALTPAYNDNRFDEFVSTDSELTSLRPRLIIER